MHSPGSTPLDQRLERLERLERKLDLVLAHLGIEYLDPSELARADLEAEIDALVRQGRQIEAIRLYRTRNPDISLMQARLIVESRATATHPVDTPGWEPPRDRI